MTHEQILPGSPTFEAPSKPILRYVWIQEENMSNFGCRSLPPISERLHAAAVARVSEAAAERAHIGDALLRY